MNKKYILKKIFYHLISTSIFVLLIGLAKKFEINYYKWLFYTLLFISSSIPSYLAYKEAQDDSEV